MHTRTLQPLGTETCDHSNRPVDTKSSEIPAADPPQALIAGWQPSGTGDWTRGVVAASWSVPCWQQEALQSIVEHCGVVAALQSIMGQRT
ncbi:hypothetical protein MDA_GLEAN10003957 [Myotis davidii]|uniref:Uncharacterized protein n=1 Tax=Myotis davidii TaxID=225400 RepID=L5LBX2_MYODS|nr:hypothetical protein MDA_GLEAN10003957 [Myotis davidii]